MEEEGKRARASREGAHRVEGVPCSGLFFSPLPSDPMSFFDDIDDAGTHSPCELWSLSRLAAIRSSAPALLLVEKRDLEQRERAEDGNAARREAE